jgi:hypothetical protein
MSIFLRVERFGGIPRLLCLPSGGGSAGEDSQGIFCAQPQGRTFFSLLQKTDGVYVTAEQKGVLLNGKPLSGTAAICNGSRLEGFDYVVTVVITSLEAEALLRHGSTLTELEEYLVTLPRLQYALQDRAQKLPLIEGLEYVIGSSPSCSVVLDSQFAAARHLSLQCKAWQVQVTPLQAPVSIAGQEATGPTNLIESSEIRLLPSGFALQITFPY